MGKPIRFPCGFLKKFFFLLLSARKRIRKGKTKAREEPNRAEIHSVFQVFRLKTTFFTNTEIILEKFQENPVEIFRRKITLLMDLLV